MSDLKTPRQWQEETGIIIHDADGWREDNKSFSDPIDQAEWNRRMIRSTVMVTDKARKALAMAIPPKAT